MEPNQGTVIAPKFHDGPTDVRADVRIRIRFFTYKTDGDLVAGAATNLQFSVDRPVGRVWPHLKDWNQWMNPYGYYWSGVVGDMEGQRVRLSIRAAPDLPLEIHPNIYQVVRAIPEHLLVLSQPVPEDGSNGAVSPGFHVYMLNDQGDNTMVTAIMEHASPARNQTVEEAIAFWRGLSVEQEWIEKWRDIFIPTLKKLISAAP